MHRRSFRAPSAGRAPFVSEAGLCLVLVIGLLLSSGGGAAAQGAALQLVAEGFDSPVHVEMPKDGSGRLAIVDRVGTVHWLTADGRLLDEPLLDVRDELVPLSAGYDERGLLGFAFHPEFANNGKVYAYYSAPLRPGAPEGWDHTSRVVEYVISPTDPNRVDPDSARLLLEIDQPQSNHNGGALVFGPDGFLYIALGDGGGGNDVGVGHPAAGNGQDTSTLLGSILRIDVDRVGADGKPYAVPDDNPFAAGGGRPEIYAWGLRNPYRFSFDRGGAGHMLIADVGQNLWEEVNLAVGPGNFGWRIKEGTFWFDPNRPSAVITSGPTTGEGGEPLIDPVIQYRHPGVRTGSSPEVDALPPLGISVIGGYVYRGDALPAWQGRYVFGDWSTNFGFGDGKILIATPPHPSPLDNPNTTYDELKNQPLWDIEVVMEVPHFVLAFGEDGAGELYVLTTDATGPFGGTGRVYKIVPER